MNINLLKDIESNDYSNPLLQILIKQLSNHIEQALSKIFGAHLDKHFNNYFTIEHFILNALYQNEINTQYGNSFKSHLFIFYYTFFYHIIEHSLKRIFRLPTYSIFQF